MPRTVFGMEEQAGPAFVETWAFKWWPVIVFAIGVAFIFAGAVLFTP